MQWQQSKLRKNSMRSLASRRDGLGALRAPRFLSFGS